MSDSILALDKHRLALVAGQWEANLKAVAALPCETPAQEQWWSDRLPAVQAAINDLEAERKELVKPLNDSVKEVNAEFKKATGPLEEFKGLVKKKLAAAAEMRLQATIEARKALADALVELSPEAAEAALEKIPEASRPAGLRTAWTWEISVVEFHEVPKKFLCVDMAALESFAAQFDPESGSLPKLPGVEFKAVAKVAGTNRGKK